MKTHDDIITKIAGKKVLFVATKNQDYLRCQQEIRLLQRTAGQSKILTSSHRNYVIRFLEVVFRLLAALPTFRPDIVFVGFASQLLFPFYFFHFFSSRSLIITDFFISMYDTFVDDRKKVKDGSLLSKVFYWIDKLICDRSDIIIADTKAHADYFIETFHQPTEKFIVYYIEADTEIYLPKDVKRPAEFIGKKVVLYFGSYLPLQGVPVILESAKELLPFRDIQFVLIGPVNNLKIKPNDYPNITFIDWLPQDELANWISVADVYLAGHFSPTIGKAKRTIPGKAYIYSVYDKPIIFGDTPANHELFEESSAKKFYYVPLGDSKALAKCIIDIVEAGINES